MAHRDDRTPVGQVIMRTPDQYRTPMPGELAYAASKGTLHQLTLRLSDHLASCHTTVNIAELGANETSHAEAALRQPMLDLEPMTTGGRTRPTLPSPEQISSYRAQSQTSRTAESPSLPQPLGEDEPLPLDL